MDVPFRVEGRTGSKLLHAIHQVKQKVDLCLIQKTGVVFLDRIQELLASALVVCSSILWKRQAVGNPEYLGEWIDILLVYYWRPFQYLWETEPN